MSVDYIKAQLNNFKLETIASKKEVDQFCHESPYLRTKREVQEELARAEKYRAGILKTLSTFANLSQEALVIAAQSMEEIIYNKGEDIIEQDDIGDSFFILEEGRVSVRRKANMRDAYEKPRELVQLGKDAHFGEIALLTAEPRSATVTVISDTARCLRMTKSRFDELLATTNKLQAENRRMIGRDVLDKVVAFRTMSAIEKKKLLDRMVLMTYLPGSYICRQGTTGNSFFILTEGHCRVTVNEEKGERDVGKLRAGDTFGEHALTDTSNRRQANVISVESVSCLTLSRADFRLLTNLKGKLLEAQAARGANNNGSGFKTNADLIQTSSLANKRRISALNTHGHRDEMRINNLFKRFAKFTTETLWNSLYSRLYRELLLDPSKQTDYGTIAEEVMHQNEQRYPTVQAIGAHAQRILELDPPRRSVADHAFVQGLLKTRNDVRDKLCKSWPAHQFGVLCKRIKMQKFIPFKKIFEIDSSGTAAYLVVRGCVRLYSKANAATSDANVPPKAFFEQDIGPGELFGEAALGGIHTRMHMAQAITHVDVIVIDDQDFMSAQDKDSNHMGTEERQKFLMAVPMFRHWDSYKLLRLAHVLIQEEVNKGVVLTHPGKPNRDMYFVVNGRIDVVTSLTKRYVVTPLLKHDYVGESSVINKFIKASANKLNEEHYAVAVTKVEVLILPEAAFTLFDLHSVDVIRSTFMAKTEWRRQRVKQMKYERAKVRKHIRSMDRECGELNEFPVDTRFLSNEQIRMMELAHGRTVTGAMTTPLATDPPMEVRRGSSRANSRPNSRPNSRGNSRAASPEPPRDTNTSAFALVNPSDTHDFAMSPQQQQRLQTSGFSPPRGIASPANFNANDNFITTDMGSPATGKSMLQTAQRPPLLVRSRPATASLARPTTTSGAVGASRDANQSTLNNTLGSPTKTMNGTAITPGKLRPKSAAGQTNTGPIEIANGKLSDIEDIPTIFVQDMDRFMALISCRTDRERTKFTTQVSQALRPKSARVREIAVRAKGENDRLAKRAAVLTVLEGKQSTKSRMIMSNRRTSAAVTANAVMIRSAMEDRVRPHTAGELNGSKAINRDDMLNALSTIGSSTSAEQEDQGVSLDVHQMASPLLGGKHVSTQNIVQQSRVLAMQSGGYKSQNVGNTAASGGGAQNHSLPSPGQFPGIAAGPNSNPKPTPSKSHPATGPESALPMMRAAGASASAVPFANSNNLLTASTYDDDDFDQDAFDSQPPLLRAHSKNNSLRNLRAGNITSTELETAIEESESHLPLCARARQSSLFMNDSSGENSREQSKKHRRGSLSLRGSLIIPMSSSYVDTLSRSNIAPKSAIVMKLEAAVEKYIHKK